MSERTATNVPVSKELTARIDNLRHATQSRTEWVNRVLLRAVVIAETSEEHGKIIS